jgi:hypothetical protein
MAIRCPQFGAEYDVTLFTFDRIIRCDCGASVDLDVGHQQTDQVSRLAVVIPRRRTPGRLPAHWSEDRIPISQYQ